MQDRKANATLYFDLQSSAAVLAAAEEHTRQSCLGRPHRYLSGVAKCKRAEMMFVVFKEFKNITQSRGIHVCA